MKNNMLDPAIKFGAGRYRQGIEMLEQCGEEIARFGKKVYIIAGKRAWEAVRERLIPSMEKADITYQLEIYTGACSYEGAEEVAERCDGYDEVIGIGGGKIMDFAMAVGEYAALGVINIPTSIATCAAFTSMSVMYTPEGQTKNNWRFDHEIDGVYVDLQVIANCPARYAAAGILDAMAKKIEMQNGRPKMYLSENSIDFFSAYKMAEYTYEVLAEYGLQAVEDIRNHKVTKAVEDITFISIALTGVLANITKSYNQSALAHEIYYGVRTFFTEEARGAVHGEIVAVGLFLQLYYNKLSEKKDELKEFMKKMGMPVSLEALGVAPTKKNLDILENHLRGTSYVIDTEENYQLLHKAMQEIV